MTYTEKILSFHIIERENNRNFHVWTYPTITEEYKSYILQKSFAGNERNLYSCRRNNVWFYFYETFSDKSFAIIIIAKEFQPNKYKILCDILARKYRKTRNPVDLVTLYLEIFVSGVCSLNENGVSLSCNFKNFESVTNLKDFIKVFDLEIILIFTAILLKRRIFIFNNNTETLLNNLLAVTKLVPSRKIDDYLYPIVETPNQLKGLSFFVVGTTDLDLIKFESLYDLFVNMESGEIKISPKAEEIMSMTKTHKEIATFLVKLSESDYTEPEIASKILQKTKELTNLLQNLASITTQNNTKMITVGDLKSKKFHPNLENFLFNLAVAENMMIL